MHIYKINNKEKRPQTQKRKRRDHNLIFKIYSKKINSLLDGFQYFTILNSSVMNCLMSVYFYIMKGKSLESVPTLGIARLGNICTSSLIG